MGKYLETITFSKSLYEDNQNKNEIIVKYLNLG